MEELDFPRQKKKGWGRPLTTKTNSKWFIDLM